jgi:hypothetical protein
MNYSKELLYHFSCEICHNWWSYPATADLEFDTKTWFCPHCLHEHKPPHTDKEFSPSAADDFLEIVRKGI